MIHSIQSLFRLPPAESSPCVQKDFITPSSRQESRLGRFSVSFIVGQWLAKLGALAEIFARSHRPIPLPQLFQDPFADEEIDEPSCEEGSKQTACAIADPFADEEEDLFLESIPQKNPSMKGRVCHRVVAALQAIVAKSSSAGLEALQSNMLETRNLELLDSQVSEVKLIKMEQRALDWQNVLTTQRQQDLRKASDLQSEIESRKEAILELGKNRSASMKGNPHFARAFWLALDQAASSNETSRLPGVLAN